MTKEEWCQKGVSRPLHCAIYVSMGTVFLSIYIPVLMSLLQGKYAKHSCYRIMIFIGVQDLIFLALLTAVQPYLFYTGAVYCCSPAVTYLMGSTINALRVTQTTSASLLALNRLADIIQCKSTSWLFEGNIVYVWMIAIVVYSGYYLFFIPPVIVTSVNHVGSPNPYSGVDDSRVPIIDRNQYKNMALFYNDSTFIVVLSVVYVLLILTIFWKVRKVNSAYMTKAKIVLLLQVTLICGLSYATIVLFFVLPGSVQWIDGYIFRAENGSLSLVLNGTDGGIKGGEQWARTFGMIYLVFGIVAVFICLFVLSVFMRPPHIWHPCYKIIVFNTVLDIINLFHAVIFAGFFSMQGINHCNSGIWVSYVAESSIEQVCLRFRASTSLAQQYIIQKTTSHLQVILTHFLTYTNREPNLVHIFNNFFKLGFITTAYIVMLAFMHRFLKNNGSKDAAKLEIKVSIQALVIAILSDLTSMGYLVIYYVPLGPALSPYAGVIGELVWASLHAGTGIVYMAMNGAVRERINAAFCPSVHTPVVSLTH
ncbi:hypothetical protein QR680_015621 [Steinernema hermaphroditum]|uniref:Uncharacterized protein n=1 Tax=Steinernema hermaphroditum TaxID=289476 RepID=A0AA39HAB6_9BILA|nr:hypothetical protein QR680_015621 [Steinernema hermaphroditum]